MSGEGPLLDWAFFSVDFCCVLIWWKAKTLQPLVRALIPFINDTPL